MGDEKKEVKIDKNENVIIPYALFEKMLKNQEEMSERFCKTILIMLFILILPILAWAIGYFILSWYVFKGVKMKKIIQAIKNAFYFGLVGIRKKKKWLIKRWKVMDAQEYINNQFNERLEKLETKVDSMENKINDLKLTNAKQTVILEKIENTVNTTNSKMVATQNKIFWGIVAAIGSLVLAFIQQLIKF